MRDPMCSVASDTSGSRLVVCIRRKYLDLALLGFYGDSLCRFDPWHQPARIRSASKVLSHGQAQPAFL